MNLKKVLLTISVVFITGLLLWIGCGHRHCFCHGDFTEWVLNRMDKKVARLELTDDQQVVYNKNRADLKADLEEFKDVRYKAFKESTEELNSENPDMGKIAGIIKQVHDEHPVKINAYIDKSVEFYNILDGRQKNMVIERLRDMADHFDCD